MNTAIVAQPQLVMATLYIDGKKDVDIGVGTKEHLEGMIRYFQEARELPEGEVVFTPADDEMVETEMQQCGIDNKEEWINHVTQPWSMHH